MIFGARFSVLWFLVPPLVSLASAVTDLASKTSHDDSKPMVVLVLSQTNLSSDCTVRPSVAINGTSPGPELRFKEGERVVIRVINRLEDRNTTIHFHGLSQLGSPFADGTEKISQFAIMARGGYFDYQFQLEIGSAGTYMYHAHVDFQLSSAYGPFIIEDAVAPRYKYDGDIVLLFGDYYHAMDTTILHGLDSKPFQWLGEPQSLVVNGHALASCNATNLYGCASGCHHHVVSVEPDKVYRVRVIGITALTYVYFGIEKHSKLDIMEADGGYVRAAQTDHIQLHSGQRYSFLLKTKTQAELRKLGSRTDFWVRIEGRWRPIRDRGAFVLRYEVGSADHYVGADSRMQQPVESGKADASMSLASLPGKPIPKPRRRDLSRAFMPDRQDFEILVPLPNEGDKWLTEVFEPLEADQTAPTSSEVTRRIIFNTQQRILADGSIRWFVNDEVYVETQPEIPFLVRAYTTGIKPDYKAAEKNRGYDAKLGAYPIKLNETIEFVFINCASSLNFSEAHPWHLHGQKAFMITEGIGEFNNHTLAVAEAKFNKKHILRDTQVLLPGLGASFTNSTAPAGTQTSWIVMRLKAQDPGAYLFHCHTQPHAVMGMALVVLIGIEHLPPLPKKFREMFLFSGIPAHSTKFNYSARYEVDVGRGR